MVINLFGTVNNPGINADLIVNMEVCNTFLMCNLGHCQCLHAVLAFLIALKNILKCLSVLGPMFFLDV